jgi:hypothetical protein
MMKRVFAIITIAVLVLSQAVPCFADQMGDMMSMMEGMKQQMGKMQETINQQNTKIQQLESKTTAQPQVAMTAPQANLAAQPPAPTQLSDADWQKGISDNLGTAVPWMKGLKFSGDFRLRYESFLYSKNYNDGLASKGLDEDYNRFRVRLRFGFDKDFGDDWKTGFRLVTGTQADQTSTNQTLGQYWTYKPIYIDRAYAAYSPNSMKDYGPIKGVTIGGGKFENPFLRYSTTLVWDPDVTPEGAYEKVDLQVVNTEDTKVNLYGAFGQLIINDNQVNNLNYANDNADMFGYQEALNVSTYAFGTQMPVDITAAVSWYDYTNWSETVSNNGAATDFIRTNTKYAEAFRVLDIYPELIFYVDRTPVTLWYDFAKNFGDHGTDNPDLNVALRGNDFHDQDTGWGVGGKIGKAVKKGQWEAYGSYFQVGANAVPAAFNDSDFGGPGTKGYTNRKGYKFGLGYQLTDSLQLYWTTYIVSPLDVSLLDQYSLNETVYRTQLDAVYKF